jgi:uncharacterized RDD family membrane protein YckC
MFCPKCGRSNDASARFCQSCGNDLVSLQSVAATVHYAGFWKRFAALVIDFAVISAATGVLVAGTLGHAWFAVFLLPWIYEAVMLSSEKQATFGKMALGMVVTDLNGARITFARATGRHFAKWLSTLFLMIGYLMAAFTEKKQALHDLFAETLVIDKPPSVV